MEKNLTLTEAIRQYISLKWEFYRLSFVEKVATLIGIVFLLMCMIILGLMLIMLFAFFGYSMLASLVGNEWIAALIEIGAVILFMVLLWIFRDRLVIQPVGNMVIRALFDAPENSKNNENGKV